MKSERQTYLDCLRTIAVVSIVMDHAVLIGYRMAYDTFGTTWEITTLIGKVLRIGFWEFSRLGVPIFLLISGALILNKRFEIEDDIDHFYKNNLFPLFINNEIWCVLHYIVAYYLARLSIPFVYVQGANIVFSFEEFIYPLLMIKRSVYPNMWFLPMIIGMYLFLPYVAKTLRDNWNNLKYIVLAMVFILFFTNDLAYFFSLINCKFQTTPIISTAFSGGIYGIYLIIGWHLSNKSSFLRRISSLCLVVTGSGIIILDLLVSVIRFDQGTRISLVANNNSLFQLILVSVIFELVRRIHFDNKTKKVSEWISSCSFPIYLLHYPVMLCVDYILGNTIYGANVFCTSRVMLQFIITFIICLCICCFVPKNKVVRKYAFHMPE